MVDDGAMVGGTDDLHRDKLATEGQDVELSTQSPVFCHHIRQSLPSCPPAGKLEHWHSILLSLQACGTRSKNQPLLAPTHIWPPLPSQPSDSCTFSPGLSFKPFLLPSQAPLGSTGGIAEAKGEVSGTALPRLTSADHKMSKCLPLPDSCLTPSG